MATPNKETFTVMSTSQHMVLTYSSPKDFQEMNPDVEWDGTNCDGEVVAPPKLAVNKVTIDN